MAFVYMLRCQDNTIYTGYAENLSKRLREHNEGKASKYTRSRLPVRMVYWEELPDRSSALRREIEIKNLTKAGKEKLLGDFKPIDQNE